MIACNHCIAQPEPVLTMVTPGEPCRRCQGVTTREQALPKKDLRFILQAKLAKTNKPLLARLWADKSERFPGYPKGIL